MVSIITDESPKLKPRPLPRWRRREILDELDAAVPALFAAQDAWANGQEWARVHVARLRPLVDELLAVLDADHKLAGVR